MPGALALQYTVLLCCSEKAHCLLKDQGAHLLRGGHLTTHPQPPSFSSKARSPTLCSHYLGQEPKTAQISVWLTEHLGEALKLLFISFPHRPGGWRKGQSHRTLPHTGHGEDRCLRPPPMTKPHCTVFWWSPSASPLQAQSARGFCHLPLTSQVTLGLAHMQDSECFLKEEGTGVKCTQGHFPLQRLRAFGRGTEHPQG